ncbi:MAG: hypothetical protein AMJ95_02250 [Omnitrophica WOR_2 bacterium SM23_72]|nr:MAG: hypothetical protein AMJ95_02250 [Omnitrophica WOR_2 bacterium SM23_72]
MRKFCIQMFIGLAVIGTILLLRHRGLYLLFYSLGALFLLGTLVSPLAKFLYFIWMKLAFSIEWVVTRLIMCLIFYLMFTPLGLVMRWFGKDFLDRRIEKEKKSYWQEKPKVSFNPTNYERQF